MGLCGYTRCGAAMGLCEGPGSGPRPEISEISSEGSRRFGHGKPRKGGEINDPKAESRLDAGIRVRVYWSKFGDTLPRESFHWWFGRLSRGRGLHRFWVRPFKGFGDPFYKGNKIGKELNNLGCSRKTVTHTSRGRLYFFSTLIMNCKVKRVSAI